MLSAQCTDERVNKVTPLLFKTAPDAETMANLGLKKIEQLIKSINFYPTKAKNILATSKILFDTLSGQVPQNIDELVELPGVGRKTANVVLGNAFGVPSLVVDTHVTRIANRLGLTHQKDAVKIETELQAIAPMADWTDLAHLFILHGRAVCTARKPLCSKCNIAKWCPSKNKAHDSWKD